MDKSCQIKRFCLSLAASAAIGGLAYAAPTVVLDGVQQRYPWNAKADITYTLSDAASVTRIVFTLVEPQTGERWTRTLDRSAASALFADGRHVYTWNLSDLSRKLRTKGARVSVAIYRDAP